MHSKVNMFVCVIFLISVASVDFAECEWKTKMKIIINKINCTAMSEMVVSLSCEIRHLNWSMVNESMELVIRPRAQVRTLFVIT